MLLPIWEMQKLLNYLFYLVCSVPVNGKKITLCTSKEIFMYILVCVAFTEIFNVLEIKDVCTEILGSRLINVIILCSSALKYFFVESFLSYGCFYL